MANINDAKQSAKVVSMEIGGRERVIQFDLNAFGELEKRFGSVQAAMEALQSGTMANLKIILWTGLVHEEAVIDEVTGEAVRYNITPYQVGSWIKTPAMLREASEKLAQALASDMPDIENMPGAQDELAKLGLEVKDGKVVQTATVVPTAEEKAKLEADNTKNA